MPSRPLVTMLWRGLRRRCPNCGKSGLFDGWFQRRDRCTRCGYRPERQEGFVLGAITINMVVTLGLMLGFMAVGMIATYPDIAAVPLTIGCVAIALVVPVALYPISHTVWAAVDLAMRPLEPAEEAEAVAWIAGQGRGD